MPYTLRVFGTIELNDPTGTPCSEILSQPKRAALLAYLAAAQPFGYQRRDKLLAMFWPDSDQSAARRSLNQSVHFLRRTLGADCVPSRGAEEIGLAAPSIECDTVSFRSAIEQEQWARALALYRGDLLAGFFVSDVPEFEEWLEKSRGAYRDDAARAAWALSRELCLQQEMDDAKRWARWAAAQTPYDESSFRRYMEFLVEIGDRATAVQAYTEFSSRLKQELGISPSVETTTLADTIRDGTALIESHVATPPVVVDTAAGEEQGTRSLRDDSPTGPIVHASTLDGPATPATSPAFATDLWIPVAVLGLAAAGALGVAYLLVIELGLPDWLMVGAASLVAVGFVVLVATALAERRRAAMPSDAAALGLHHRLSWRRSIQAGALAWLALGVSGVGYQTLGRFGVGPAATLVSRGILEDRDEILVAEFENHTSDSALGHAMTEATRIDLSQSRAVRLVDPDRIVSTLRLMSVDLASSLDGDIARGVAQRLGVKAIVQGDITAVGNGYLLSVSLLSSNDGSILWADRGEATSADALIQTIGQLSRGVRAEIGESLRDVRKTPPLEDVTTTSIDALKAYSEAQRIMDFRDQRDAVPLFTRAVLLDSTFAIAYQKIARVLANTGASRTRQAEAIERAFRLRHRTTEIERLLIESTYYALTGDGEQALATWRRLNNLQPEVWNWWNNVGHRVGGNLAARFPDHEESVTYLNRAFELCQCAFPLGNLTTALLIAGMTDSAQSVIENYSSRFPEMGGGTWQLLRGARAYAIGDLALAVDELGADRPRFRDVSAVLAVQGKLSASRDVFEEWSRARSSDGPAASYLGSLAYHEKVAVMLGRSEDDAVRRVEDALRTFPIDSIDPLDRPYVQLAEFFVRAGQVDRAAGLIEEFENTIEPRWRRLAEWRHLLVRGLIEQEEAGSERALPTLERAVEQAHAYLGPVPDYGFALDRVGRTDSAIAVFERFIGPSPRYAAWRFDAMWRASVLKRLGELHEERGDRQSALEYYRQFVELWSDADPELQPQVDDVMQRIARLAGEAASLLPVN